MKYGLWPEINHRNLDGIYAEIKSLTKILDQNALEFLAFGNGFILDRIGDARIFGAARAENKSKNLFFAESREK